MPLSLDKLLYDLDACGILPREKLRSLLSTLPEPSKADAEKLAGELVRQKALTAYQAQIICQGRAADLVLGDYVVRDKIGAGGMGQVFQAQHRRMKRLVAIKLLPPSLSENPDAIRRFEREVEAAAKLSHPNIVVAYDAGCTAAGRHYLALEYVAGSDLSSWVKRHGPLTPERAVAVMLQAARGLAYAHCEGVIHRDIKPANLLLDSHGHVKILDMGLARLDSAGAQQDELTGTGQILGTVDYMAPEQARNTKLADARADIYSLGITLWFLLTGRATHRRQSDGEAAGTSKRTDPVTHRRLSHRTPELEQIVRQMIAKRPDDRYADMDTVIEALEGWQQSSVHPAGGDCGTEATGAWIKISDSAQGALVMAKPLSTEVQPIDSGPTVSLHDVHVVTTIQARPIDESPPDRGWAWWLIGGAAGAVALTVLVIVVISQNPGPPQVSSNAATPGDKSSIAPSPKPGPPRAIVPFSAAEARTLQELWTNYLQVQPDHKAANGMQLRLIPPGEFQMGSVEAEIEAVRRDAEALGVANEDRQRTWSEEGPQHLVRLTQPYWCGATEVTIGEFRRFVNDAKYKTEAEKALEGKTPNPNDRTWEKPGWAEVTEEHPVTMVSCRDAFEYCNWLSRQEQLPEAYVWTEKAIARTNRPGYRLPTEAEWEFACRAGTTTRFYFGDDHREMGFYAWHNRNAQGRAHAVRRLNANAFGLFDMPGNVWEVCQDPWDEQWYTRSPLENPNGPPGGTHVVMRGGSWLAGAMYGRSAARYRTGMSFRFSANGFRVVRTIPLGK